MKARLGIFLLLIMFCFAPIAEAKHSRGADKPIKAEDMNYPAVYNKVSANKEVWAALEVLNGTTGEFSKNAILGSNLTKKPIKVQFTNLRQINEAYANYDALGLKKGSQLYIHINQKHQEAPPEALAALLSHEALHQDEHNSLNEEIYAWTMEARVWYELCNKKPSLRKINDSSLVNRENILSKMLENADFSNRLIKNSVVKNPVYKALPRTSPGFESN